MHPKFDSCKLSLSISFVALWKVRTVRPMELVGHWVHLSVVVPPSSNLQLSYHSLGIALQITSLEVNTLRPEDGRSERGPPGVSSCQPLFHQCINSQNQRGTSCILRTKNERKTEVAVQQPHRNKSRSTTNVKLPFTI